MGSFIQNPPNWLQAVCLGSVALVALLLLLQLVDFRVIRENERLILTRFGRLRPLAGPGPVMLWKWIHRAERTINVRNRLNDITVGLFFFHGVPFQYTLNVRYRLNLTRYSKSQRWIDLIEMTDDERERQVINTIFNGLTHAIPAVQKAYPIDDEQSFVYRIFPIFPGMDGSKAIIERLIQHLDAELPAIGVVLDRTHPIAIRNVHLPDDMVTSFALDRTISLLQESMGDVAEDTFIQMVAAIDGIDPPRVQKMIVNEEYAEGMQMEMRDEDGETSVRNKWRPSRNRRRASEAHSTPSTAPAAPESPEVEREARSPVAAQTSADEDFLAPSDLDVLKTLPAYPERRDSRAA